MTSDIGPDPLDQLRAADPAPADEVPGANLARVQARVQEHIVTDISRDIARPSRGPLAAFGGLVLGGALALALVVGGGLNALSPTPSVDPGNGAAGGGGMASCLMYDPATLPTFETVFDGTVTAIDGDQVTFDVNTGWKGVGDRVTLTAPNVDAALTGPLPDFAVGGRYLVTAAGSTINACGYTLDHDADTAADWAAAFAG